MGYMDKHDFKYKNYDLAEYCHRTFIEFREITKHVDNLYDERIIDDKQKYISKLLDKIEKYDELSYKDSNLKLLCYRNKIKYFLVILYIISRVGDKTNVSELLIEEAIKYGINNSKKAKPFNEIVYPSKEASIEFLNSINNKFLLDNLDESKLMYNGMVLKEYCESVSISYENVLDKIKYNLVYKCKLSLDEIIEKAVKFYSPKVPKKHGPKSIYFYKGEEIPTVCKNKNIDNAILYKTLSIKRKNLKKVGQNVSMQELYTEFFTKYEIYERLKYKGKRLIDYLNENNINAYSVIMYIDNNASKLSGYTMSEIIEMAIYCAEHKKTILLFYKGQPVFDYCRKNGIKPGTFKSFYTTIKAKHPKFKAKQVMEYCVNAIQPLISKDCNYKGLSLIELSSLSGIEYYRLFNGLLKKLEKLSDVKKALEIVFISLLDPNLKIGDELLFDYCLDRKYDYIEVTGLINRIIEVKNKEIGEGHAHKGKPRVVINNNIIREALLKYEARRNPKYLKEMINFLKTRTHKNTSGLYKVLNFLNLDQMYVGELIVRGYSPYTATMMTYYFYDSYTTETHTKCLSDKKLENLETFIKAFKDERFKNQMSNINYIFLLVRLYKCGLVDTRDQIFRLKSDMINRCVNEYYIPEQLVKNAILETIDNCNSNDKETMLKAIDRVEDTCKTVIVCPSFINIGILTKTKCKKEDK